MHPGTAGRSRVEALGMRSLVVALGLLLVGACKDDPPAPPAATAGVMAPRVEEFDSPTQLAGGKRLPKAPAPQVMTLELPDVALTNQAGQEVRLRQLLAGKIAVIQTIFTSCGTICPPMGSNFGRLQSLIADQSDVILVSVSIDPITDTPARLAAWGEKFGASDRWTMVTGSSQDIRDTLKALKTFTAEKEDHSSMVAIGHQDANVWTRVDGLSDPKTLADAVAQVRKTVGARVEDEGSVVRAGAAEAPVDEVARKYFSDVELVDQHGKTHRLYTDLLRGKVVIINSFFTSCESVCPPMTQRLAELQSSLQGRMNEDLFILSLSVDPITDTPPRLAAYAEKFDAGEGWLFLTGDKANVDLALGKLGFAVEVPEGHSNLFVVGNEPTGLWKKAFGLAEPKALLEVVTSVLDDDGGPIEPADALGKG